MYVAKENKVYTRRISYLLMTESQKLKTITDWMSIDTQTISKKFFCFLKLHRFKSGFIYGLKISVRKIFDHTNIW